MMADFLFLIFISLFMLCYFVVRYVLPVLIVLALIYLTVDMVIPWLLRGLPCYKFAIQC